MDFSTSDEMKTLLDGMRAFVDEHIIAREDELLADGFFAAEPALDALREIVRERGWWMPQAPKAIGGLGLSVMEHGMVSEQLGRSPFGHYVFGCQAPDAGNVEILHEYGTPEQKQRFLEPLAKGSIRSCFSMTEPDHPGSNPTRMSCTAERDGDSYVINGRKWFTTSADGAAFAVVMAVTDPDGPRYGQASQIIVPCDTPGFIVERNIPVMGHRGEGWMSHAQIRYEDCRVPVSHLLGTQGAGFLIAQQRLGPGRIHHCMRWIGICERAFEMMCRRAVSRQLDGEKTLAHKQIIQAWVAESRASIDAARLMVLQAAWKIDRVGYSAARVDISLIKFFVADVMMKVVDRAIQVHGALGITDDTVLALFYAQERGARIYDGPDEVHKVSAARRILAEYD